MTPPPVVCGAGGGGGRHDVGSFEGVRKVPLLPHGMAQWCANAGKVG